MMNYPKKNRVVHIISVILVLAATMLSSCGDEYKRVSVEELTSNVTKYDGQRIKVNGDFLFHDPISVSCGEINTSEEIIQKDEYGPYAHSLWGICENEIVVMALICNESICDYDYVPDYESGQEIEIKGVARYSTTPPTGPCGGFSNVRYLSIYIEVAAEDVPSPKKLLLQ